MFQFQFVFQVINFDLCLFYFILQGHDMCLAQIDVGKCLQYQNNFEIGVIHVHDQNK